VHSSSSFLILTFFAYYVQIVMWEHHHCPENTFSHYSKIHIQLRVLMMKILFFTPTKSKVIMQKHFSLLLNVQTHSFFFLQILMMILFYDSLFRDLFLNATALSVVHKI